MRLKGLNYDSPRKSALGKKNETIFPSLNDRYRQTMVMEYDFHSIVQTGGEVVQVGDTVSQSNSDHMASSNDQLRHQ